MSERVTRGQFVVERDTGWSGAPCDGYWSYRRRADGRIETPGVPLYDDIPPGSIVEITISVRVIKVAAKSRKKCHVPWPAHRHDAERARDSKRLARREKAAPSKEGSPMIRPLKPGVFGAAKFRHSADAFPIARISLHRWWDPTLAIDPVTKRPADDRFRPLVMIGVNPSEAGADGDDNTSAKLQTFARREGANGTVMVNLTPEITKDPEQLGRVLLPYGCDEEHWEAVDAALSENAVAIVAAFGKPPRALSTYRDRVARVKDIAGDVGVPLMCFGTNGDGSPKHPLYLAASTPLELWWRAR